MSIDVDRLTRAVTAARLSWYEDAEDIQDWLRDPESNNEWYLSDTELAAAIAREYDRDGMQEGQRDA